MMGARISIDSAIGRLCRKLIEKSSCYGALASCFKAMEDNVSTRCSSYLVDSQLAEVPGYWGGYTDRKQGS